MGYRPGRSDLSLIESLIVVVIVALAVGLLFPAVQKVREASFRSHCRGNLQQIAHGVESFRDSHGILPVGGGGFNQPDVRTIVPWGATRWGVGDPNDLPHEQHGSWLYAILPYVGEEDAYRNRTFSCQPSNYLCPQRRPGAAQMPPLRDPLNRGFGVNTNAVRLGPWGKTDYAGNSEVIVPRRAPSPDIGDGRSNTILAGEKSLDPKNFHTGVWYWDEPFFTGGNGGTRRSGDRVEHDEPENNFANNWGSSHRSVTLFAMLDGSVRGVKFEIASVNLRMLLTPNGKEAFPPTQD